MAQWSLATGIYAQLSLKSCGILTYCLACLEFNSFISKWELITTPTSMTLLKTSESISSVFIMAPSAQQVFEHCCLCLPTQPACCLQLSNDGAQEKAKGTGHLSVDYDFGFHQRRRDSSQKQGENFFSNTGERPLMRPKSEQKSATGDVSVVVFGMGETLALMPSKKGQGVGAQKRQGRGRKKKGKAGVCVCLHFPKAQPQVYFRTLTFGSCSSLLCVHLLKVDI